MQYGSENAGIVRLGSQASNAKSLLSARVMNLTAGVLPHFALKMVVGVLVFC